MTQTPELSHIGIPQPKTIQIKRWIFWLLIVAVVVLLITTIVTTRAAIKNYNIGVGYCEAVQQMANTHNYYIVPLLAQLNTGVNPDDLYYKINLDCGTRIFSSGNTTN